MDCKKNCGTQDALYNVKCDAGKCVYHGADNYCHADSIKVANPAASSKNETFCATYELK